LFKNIIEEINSLFPHKSSIDQTSNTKTSYDSLNDIKSSIPNHFIYVLSAFENPDEKSKVASQLLEVVLYAQAKLKHEKKAYNWLSSGKVPQTTYDSISNMSQFRKKCQDLHKAFQSLTDLTGSLNSNESKLKQNPNDVKLHKKSDKLEQRVEEAKDRYKKKTTEVMDALEGLVLGIGSERL
jgi:6-phosphogluconolactonase/glucosamine-6-phosphate isomerase/deaminase